jgi:4,5-dihydroxyphthalate decarboxylase
MGHDFWPYGIAANAEVLNTQLRWSSEDGLQARPIRIEDVFAADCLDT